MKTLNTRSGLTKLGPGLNFMQRLTGRAFIVPSQSKTRNWEWSLLAVVLLFAPGLLFAQQYSIDWYKISGGGSTSTGGVFTVSGTIGQPDAGMPMTGGNFSLTGGFWALYAVVQTPGAPLLTLTHSGNSVIISWPSTPTGFTLQQNSNVANANGWSDFGGTVNDDGTTRSVAITPPTGNWYFRLKQ